MAYVDQRAGGNERAAAIAGVGLIQVAVVIALVNGLAVHFLDRSPETRTVGVQVPLDPLPPPRPQPEDTARPAEPVAASASRIAPPIDLGVPSRDLPVDQPGLFLPPLPPIDPIQLDPPAPPPPAQASAARPRGNPGAWVTANDYPAHDLRAGHQGTVRFRLAIGADGSVRSCAITQSSGHPGLDDATCRRLLRRASFAPALDTGGKAMAGEYASAVRWVIPE